MKKRKYNKCKECRHLTDIRVGIIDYRCEVSGREVPPGYGCSRWKNKVPWYKRARLCVVNFFRGVRRFFKYSRG